MDLLNDIDIKLETSYNSVIEIPKGSNNKYEYDEHLKWFKLDRILLSAMVYPGNYGFIPQTIADDGDAIDVLVIKSGTIHMGNIVNCYPLGALDMTDNGKRDIKVISIPTFHYKKEKYTSLSDLDKFQLEHIEHFFLHYKDIEKKDVKINGWLSSDESLELIRTAHKEWRGY